MAPISTGRSLLFRRPFLNFASHFHPFPHRLLGRDGSRFPRLSSATHLALFKQFHPQNMCSSYNMGARRGPCVGSGAPRGWDMASLHPSAPQRVLLGEPADVTRTCVTMEWFVKPETALRLGSSEAFLVDASAYEWASKHGHAVPLCRRLHAVQGW